MTSVHLELASRDPERLQAIVEGRPGVGNEVAVARDHGAIRRRRGRDQVTDDLALLQVAAGHDQNRKRRPGQFVERQPGVALESSTSGQNSPANRERRCAPGRTANQASSAHALRLPGKGTGSPSRSTASSPNNRIVSMAPPVSMRCRPDRNGPKCPWCGGLTVD